MQKYNEHLKEFVEYIELINRSIYNQLALVLFYFKYCVFFCVCTYIGGVMYSWKIFNMFFFFCCFSFISTAARLFMFLKRYLDQLYCYMYVDIIHTLLVFKYQLAHISITICFALNLFCQKEYSHTLKNILKKMKNWFRLRMVWTLEYGSCIIWMIAFSHDIWTPVVRQWENWSKNQTIEKI